MSYRVNDFETYVGPHRIFVEAVRPEMETGRPAIVFVGGAFDGSWICRQQLDYWAARGWPAYALNLRGYYKSRYHSIAGLSYCDYLDDIRNVRDHLALNRVIYAGYSLGGILIQKFAELHGAHALVLYDSDPPRQVARRLGEKPDLGRTIPPVMNFWPTLEIAEEMMGKKVSEADYRGILEYFKQSFLSGRAWRELEIERIEVDAKKITCPVLLVGISPGDRFQEALAEYYGASRLIFEGYSHGSILLSRFHKPITRRVAEWMEGGYPRGLRESYRFEEIASKEAGERKTRLFYFTGWKKPTVEICNRRGQELLSVPMSRVDKGRSPDETLFAADLSLDPGEKFYLKCQNAEDRPYAAGYYEPIGPTLYLRYGEFFSRCPADFRQVPLYLSREIRSPEFDHDFRISIMLPRNYGKGEGGPYPVAFLNDGQNQWKNQGANGGWHTDASAWDSACRGRIRDLVLVTVVSPPGRDSAYLPPPQGRADLYVDFIADTVLPRLREEINLSREAAETAMIGASYAANCSVYAGLKRKDTFGLVGSLSYPHVPEDPVREWMRSLPVLPFKKLYVDCGTRWAYDQPHRDDFTDVTRDLIAIARSKKMIPEENLLGIIAEGHFHHEVFWRKRIGRCLEFLFPL